MNFLPFMTRQKVKFETTRSFMDSFYLCREEVGPDAARKFLGHTQWLVNYWLLQTAFSIGIGDTIADAATMEKINETISKAKNEVKELISKAQSKSLEAEPGRTMMDSFENKVNQVCYLVFWVQCYSGLVAYC